VRAQGIGTDSAPLFASPALVQEIRGTGLLLATWGSRNSDPAAVLTQAEWGVCALITDAVSRSVQVLREDELERSAGPEKPPAPTASPAPVRAAMNALPPFLGGAGNIPEAVMRAHPLKDIHFASEAEDVRCVFDRAGNVGVRQKPLPEDRVYGEPLTPAEKRENAERAAVAAAAAAAGPAAAAAMRGGHTDAHVGCECRDGVICHSCIFGIGGNATAALVRSRQSPRPDGAGPSGAGPSSAVADEMSVRGFSNSGGGGGGSTAGSGVQARMFMAGASGAAAAVAAAGMPPAGRRNVAAGGRLGLAQLLQSPRLWMV
jgi:hypothetical protein